MDTISAAVIFAVLLYMIIKVARESIQGYRAAERMTSDGIELDKPIPVYFYVGTTNGGISGGSHHSIKAGTDPCVLFNQGEQLVLFQCQKHLYPRHNEKVDGSEIPHWLVGGVWQEINKKDIVTIEIHRVTIPPRVMQKIRKNNFWKWYRRASHPILFLANLRDILCTTVVVILCKNGSEYKQYRFAIPDDIPNIVSVPLSLAAPQWYQNLEGLAEFAGEANEAVKKDAEVPEPNAPAFEHAKVMAAQIKTFAPQVNVRMINGKK